MCGYIFLGIQITPVTQGRVKKGSSDSGVSVPGIEFSLYRTNDINIGSAEPQFLLIIFSQISIITGLTKFVDVKRGFEDWCLAVTFTPPPSCYGVALPQLNTLKLLY